MSGPTLAALSVDGVALAAEFLEDLLAGDRVADVRRRNSPIWATTFSRSGFRSVAEFAERFFHGPECFAVVALQDFAEVIGVEHAFGKFVPAALRRGVFGPTVRAA